MIINKFRGPYAWLSNFYISWLRYKDHVFSTVEQAYVWEKLKDPKDKKRIFSLNAKEAKRFGRERPIRDDWDIVKFDIMKDIIIEKFKCNSILREKLLDTKRHEIIEGNWWHDNVWGQCICDECKNIPGENHLGKILMEVREYFRNGNEDL